MLTNYSFTMKALFYILLLWPLSAVNLVNEVDKNECKNSAYILDQSYKFHDPAGSWNDWHVKMHIQEPRLQNPQRYSIVNLNNEDNSFSLVRNRDKHTSKHIVDKEGQPSVLFNDSPNIPQELVEKYRLEANRSLSYQDFYKVMYGLPMSLKDRIVSMQPAATIIKNNEEVYVVDVKLNKPIFTDHWKMLISKNEFSLLGLELINDDQPEDGEILEFEELIELEGIKVPRIRHWYQPEGKLYQGSDIVIKPLE